MGRASPIEGFVDEEIVSSPMEHTNVTHKISSKQHMFLHHETISSLLKNINLHIQVQSTNNPRKRKKLKWKEEKNNTKHLSRRLPCCCIALCHHTSPCRCVVTPSLDAAPSSHLALLSHCAVAGLSNLALLPHLCRTFVVPHTRFDFEEEIWGNHMHRGRSYFYMQ